MEFFQRAKAVRLRSQHSKFLTASSDEVSVKQTRTGSSKSARWIVEPVDGKPNLFRFKSAETWKYLSAADEPYLLGMTGKKVVQASPLTRSDPAVEWEPVSAGSGSLIRLRTRKGNFLKANLRFPPYKNSVTHDVGSTSSWDRFLWMVDILEVEHQSQPLVVEEEVVVDQTAENEDDNHDDDDELSRSSSYSECYDEIGSPARSVKSPVEASELGPRDSLKSSAGVSPLIQQHLHQDSQHTNSFHKLKSVLDDIKNLIDDDYEEDKPNSDINLDQSSEASNSRPHIVEVKMAKQVLKELKSMNFSDILSSEREKKLEKAVQILVSDAKHSTLGQVPKDLIYLQDTLKSMKNDHELASQDLIDCTNFSARKISTRAELKKDATKAHELQYMEVGFTNMLATSTAKKEELLRQLEEIDNSIRAAERSQADNAVEVDELLQRIAKKSVSIMEMENEEKTMQARKLESERTLERVEEEWVQVKSLFQDV